MIYEDLKTGDVFAIEGSISYPKLKLIEGYIDMRDRIVNSTGNTVKGREVKILSFKEMAEKFEITEREIEAWINQVKGDTWLK